MGSLAAEPLWVNTTYTPAGLCQRVQVNRSPVESPPVAKKVLKSTPSTGSLQFMSTGNTLLLRRSADVGGKENRSILKRSGTGKAKSWHGTLRKVNFEQNILVVVFDPSDGEYVCSESQRLNTDPRDRREFVSRTLLGRRQQNGRLSEQQHQQQQSLTTALKVPSSDHLQTDRSAVPRPLPALSSAACLSEQNMDFAFFEDSQGQLRLKFTVPLGGGVAAGDALVKANVAGNKVRVLGTRTVGAAREEFNSRFSLPMDVDPYAITARMDSVGNLYVEAPVLTAERRRTLTAEKAGKVLPGGSARLS